MVGQIIMKWPSADEEDKVLDILMEVNHTLKHLSLPVDTFGCLCHMLSVNLLTTPSSAWQVFMWETTLECEGDPDALMMSACSRMFGCILYAKDM